MKFNNIELSKLQAEKFKLNDNLIKMSVDQVFTARESIYMNNFNLYLAYYNIIPNVITEKGIDCRKAHCWFIANYREEITDTYYNKRFLSTNKTTEFDDIFHFLDEDLLLAFDTGSSYVRFLYRQTAIDKVNVIIDGIKKFKQKRTRDKPMMSLLVRTHRGIDVKVLEINRTKLNIETNYNEDFVPVHQIILQRLTKKNDKGLVILHGKPGTGKTSYIRHLVSVLKKEVIFLPSNMATEITNPDLIGVLIDNPNSVLIIEDAENIVIDREKDGNSPVSALLNLSDGLLADCLNIQIICSFNTDISKVDHALMRKGRLIAKYEFKELTLDKTQQLSKKLGFDTLVNEPMTLASIYNQSEMSYLKKNTPQSIGFNLSA